MSKITLLEPEDVLPREIDSHQIFKDFHEHLGDDAFLLKVAKHFQPEAVHLLLQLHPIYGVKIKKQVTCIAGIRTLNIASQILPPELPIPIHMFRKLNDEQIARYCYADILLTPLALSLDSGGHFAIDTLLAKLGTRSSAWTDLADCSKVGLAKAFGLSRGSLYANERKKRQSG